MSDDDHLVLYYHQECGFSRSVLNTITNLGIGSSVDLRNIRENDGFREELVTICGDEQVPTLLVDGKSMRESDAINTFLVDQFLD